MKPEEHTPTVILVGGLPGAGKTTLAQKIAHELHIPLISKDDMKVILFDTYGWKDREESKKAGMASFKLIDYILQEQLRVGNSLIIESTFKPEYDNDKFQALQQRYNVQFVQLFCYADADIIRDRFIKRAAGDKRHVSSVEGDAGLQNLEDFIAQGFNPLHVKGQIIKVDTSDFAAVNETALIQRIRSTL